MTFCSVLSACTTVTCGFNRTTAETSRGIGSISLLAVGSAGIQTVIVRPSSWITRGTRFGACSSCTAGGARGILTASQVAVGNLNNLSLKVYGTRAGLEWAGETPEILRFTPFGEPTRLLVRGGAANSPEARRASRMPAGHPEGYIEGFANLYRDAASLIRARRWLLLLRPLAHPIAWHSRAEQIGDNADSTGIAVRQGHQNGSADRQET